MRVLVTGHRGYIGTLLAPKLAERGMQVVGLDSDLYRACNYGTPKDITPSLVRDIRDVTAADMAGIDARPPGVSGSPPNRRPR